MNFYFFIERKKNDFYLFTRTLVVDGIRLIDMAEITKLKGKRKVYERFLKKFRGKRRRNGEDFRDFREQLNLPIPLISLFT